ncbi:MAG: acid shock protein, partial [Clostridia bacterium]|nr:acid shock protein [Clostridia bacterium]
MKRVLSLALAALMVLSIAACAQEPQQQGEDTTPPVTDPAVTTPAETEPEDRSKIDDLPADLNYNGADFTLYTRQNQFFHSNITVEESTGDQLNDALYDRELAIEERLGLNISEIMSASSS